MVGGARAPACVGAASSGCGAAGAIPSSPTPRLVWFQTVTSHHWCGRIIVDDEGTESTALFPRRSLIARL
jgi:hypothetical protein